MVSGHEVHWYVDSIMPYLWDSWVVGTKGNCLETGIFTYGPIELMSSNCYHLDEGSKVVSHPGCTATAVGSCDEIEP